MSPPVFSLLRSVLLQLLGGKILLQVALVARQWEAVCDPGQEGHRPAVLLQLSGLLLHVNLVAAGESEGGGVKVGCDFNKTRVRAVSSGGWGWGVPVLLGAEGGAAAAVAVDLLHSGADVIVAHVQHVEAGRRRRAQQGGAVQQRQAALCQSRLQKSGFFLVKNRNKAKTEIL